MKFSSLFQRIGKQPLSVTQHNDVFVILDYEDVANLLKEKKCCYRIPLELKYGNGQQKLWFIKKKEKGKQNHK